MQNIIVSALEKYIILNTLTILYSHVCGPCFSNSKKRTIELLKDKDFVSRSQLQLFVINFLSNAKVYSLATTRHTCTAVVPDIAKLNN